MKTEDQILQEAQARLDARREELGKSRIPRSIARNAGEWVLLSDVIRKVVREIQEK